MPALIWQLNSLGLDYQIKIVRVSAVYMWPTAICSRGLCLYMLATRCFIGDWQTYKLPPVSQKQKNVELRNAPADTTQMLFIELGFYISSRFNLCNI